jgi:hypothetical protein
MHRSVTGTGLWPSLWCSRSGQVDPASYLCGPAVSRLRIRRVYDSSGGFGRLCGTLTYWVDAPFWMEDEGDIEVRRAKNKIGLGVGQGFELWAGVGGVADEEAMGMSP